MKMSSFYVIQLLPLFSSAINGLFLNINRSFFEKQPEKSVLSKRVPFETLCFRVFFSFQIHLNSVNLGTIMMVRRNKNGTFQAK